jgi:hypothetical protein
MIVDPKSLSGEALRRYDTWRTLGLSESAAIEELRRDGLIEEDGFERAVGLFMRLGLSEAEARTAAVGRMSEAEARRGYGAATTETSEGAHPLVDMARKIVEVREGIREVKELERQRSAREHAALVAAAKKRRRT